MKHIKHMIVETLRRTCGAWLMVAAAPLAGAQTSSPAPAPAAPPAAASTATPSAGQSGYLFGLTFGEQLHNVGVSDQVALEDIERGLKDGLQGKKSTPADRQQVQEFVRAAMASAITRNQTAAKDFLARNGHEKGVMTTASGLEYKVISAGDRKAPAIAPTDAVTVQYRGKLLDGTEFDSTYARGVPASFTVNGVIPGWQEALVLMKPGAKWQLFVPPELAYGARPQPGIPGGSLLIFEVELVSVKPSGAAAPARPAPKTN
jgi:peptidylprolyl isomerase/FKBP-type peptidyl-prolyl cis-trans isomerase FklB